jgi:hypothetical protein
MFVQLVTMGEYQVLELLELAGIMSENALNDMVIELFLIQKPRLIKKHEVLLKVLHHVPLAQEVSRRCECCLNACAHGCVKVCDYGPRLFAIV